MKSIAVILTGCGVFDGSEIHESVLTILALNKNNAKVTFFAPDESQSTVINHVNGKEKQRYAIKWKSLRVYQGEK